MGFLTRTKKTFGDVAIDENKEKHFLISEGKGIIKQTKKTYYKFRTLIRKTFDV